MRKIVQFQFLPKHIHDRIAYLCDDGTMWIFNGKHGVSEQIVVNVPQSEDESSQKKQLGKKEPAEASEA